MQEKSELSNSLIHVGKESQYSGKLKDLKIENKITNFPHVDVGWSVVCAFNKWGIDGLADMYVCRTLEDMQVLAQKYRQGIAFSINWYTIQNYYLEGQISLSRSGEKSYVEKESTPTTFSSFANASLLLEKNSSFPNKALNDGNVLLPWQEVTLDSLRPYGLTEKHFLGKGWFKSQAHREALTYLVKEHAWEIEKAFSYLRNLNMVQLIEIRKQNLSLYQPNISELSDASTEKPPKSDSSTHYLQKGSQDNCSSEEHQVVFITSLNKRLKAQKEEEERLLPIAIMLISNLIKTNDFELSLILNTWSCINFKSDIPSEILQKYISELSSVGLSFEALEVKKPSSVFTAIPPILQINALPSKIVEKLSAAVQLSSNNFCQGNLW